MTSSYVFKKNKVIVLILSIILGVVVFTAMAPISYAKEEYSENLGGDIRVTYTDRSSNDFHKKDDGTRGEWFRGSNKEGSEAFKARVRGNDAAREAAERKARKLDEAKKAADDAQKKEDERVAQAAARAARKGACFGGGLLPDSWFIDPENCVNQASFVFFKLTTYGITQSGRLMDMVFDFTVINFKERIDGVGGLGEVMVEGWMRFRDLANIAFIFVLLYAAISIITGINDSGAKRIVGMVIIIAILINFSYFLTSVVIDTSNRLAFEFHSAIKISGGGGEEGFKYGEVFLKPLKIGGFFTINGKISEEAKSAQDYAARLSNEDGGGSIQTTTRFIMGTMFLLVAIFVFLAVCVLFIGRFVGLIFLLMLSPLAFVAKILPNTEKYFKQWLDALLGQSFFAPVFFMLLWITIKLISSPGFESSIGFGEGPSKPIGDQLLAPMIGFSIAIGFLIFTLIAAKQMGVAGANSVIKTGNSMRGWAQNKLGKGAGAATFGLAGFAGRRTVGWGAAAAGDAVASSKFGKSMAGRVITRGLRGVAGSSMDLRSAPIIGGVAAAAGLGAGAGKGGYTAGVEHAAQMVVDKAKVVGKTTHKEQTIISEAKEKRDDIKNFTDDFEKTKDYKDADKAATEAKDELKRLEDRKKDAVAEGNTAAEAKFRDQIADQNVNVNDTKKKLGVLKAEAAIAEFGENWEDLAKKTASLTKKITDTEKLGRERQRAQIESVGTITKGMTSWAVGDTFDRGRVRTAARQKANIKSDSNPKKDIKTDNKDGGDKKPSK